MASSLDGSAAVWGPVVVAAALILANLTAYALNEHSWLHRHFLSSVRAPKLFFASNRARGVDKHAHPATYWGFDVLDPVHLVECPFCSTGLRRWVWLLLLHATTLMYAVAAIVVNTVVDRYGYGCHPAWRCLYQRGVNPAWFTLLTNWSMVLMIAFSIAALANTARHARFAYLQYSNIPSGTAKHLPMANSTLDPSGAQNPPIAEATTTALYTADSAASVCASGGKDTNGSKQFRHSQSADMVRTVAQPCQKCPGRRNQPSLPPSTDSMSTKDQQPQVAAITTAQQCISHTASNSVGSTNASTGTSAPPEPSTASRSSSNTAKDVGLMPTEALADPYNSTAQDAGLDNTDRVPHMSVIIGSAGLDTPPPVFKLGSLTPTVPSLELTRPTRHLRSAVMQSSCEPPFVCRPRVCTPSVGGEDFHVLPGFLMLHAGNLAVAVLQLLATPLPIVSTHFQVLLWYGSLYLVCQGIYGGASGHWRYNLRWNRARTAGLLVGVPLVVFGVFCLWFLIALVREAVWWAGRRRRQGSCNTLLPTLSAASQP